MRELIDIAINKGIKQFYIRVRDSGLQLADSDASKEKYLNELEGIENNDLINQIKQKGYWKIIIRPTSYEENRIGTLVKCQKLLQENKLSLRGWDFPHIAELENGNQYVQAIENFGQYKELLRLYKSGQFIYYKSMSEEHMEEQFSRRVNGKGLEIISTLYLYTEIFEFASRLAQHKSLGEEINVSIECHDIKGRKLFFYDVARPLFRDYISNIEETSQYVINVGIDELISNSNTLAIEALNQLFEKFNWDTTGVQGVFKDEQQKFLNGRYLPLYWSISLHKF
ncbi:hypothetical protein [Heyndrickxia camelliae]|uniref:Uncharacterized protein n=1 Tax=Heyndrickxia camelliae TaxID=1707093 RepID=A0A2N3LD35_9BACI|nr:hypothetical protein [Heyndrickxia camelliae]PKR82457.1 hypothetical protein CWO92_24270 [Heyndrickxia camelliae]